MGVPGADQPAKGTEPFPAWGRTQPHVVALRQAHTRRLGRVLVAALPRGTTPSSHAGQYPEGDAL
eukprot:354993-Chlamydomonas_euryale.AAC.3